MLVNRLGRCCRVEWVTPPKQLRRFARGVGPRQLRRFARGVGPRQLRRFARGLRPRQLRRFARVSGRRPVRDSPGRSTALQESGGLWRLGPHAGSRYARLVSNDRPGFCDRECPRGSSFACDTLRSRCDPCTNSRTGRSRWPATSSANTTARPVQRACPTCFGRGAGGSTAPMPVVNGRIAGDAPEASVESSNGTVPPPASSTTAGTPSATRETRCRACATVGDARSPSAVRSHARSVASASLTIDSCPSTRGRANRVRSS
jgi:hypothetical protein